MRDVGRIEPFLRELAFHWKHMPDLRLGQFLVDALLEGTPPLYYIEDDALLEKLRDFSEKVADGQSGEGPVYDGS